MREASQWLSWLAEALLSLIAQLAEFLLRTGGIDGRSYPLRRACEAHDAFHVLRNDVHFEIHFIVRTQVRKICSFPGLGNHGDFKVVIAEAGNRQTDAFDRD